MENSYCVLKGPSRVAETLLFYLKNKTYSVKPKTYLIIDSSVLHRTKRIKFHGTSASSHQFRHTLRKTINNSLVNNKNRATIN